MHSHVFANNTDFQVGVCAVCVCVRACACVWVRVHLCVFVCVYAILQFWDQIYVDKQKYGESDASKKARPQQIQKLEIIYITECLPYNVFMNEEFTEVQT